LLGLAATDPGLRRDDEHFPVPGPREWLRL